MMEMGKIARARIGSEFAKLPTQAPLRETGG
jgi:hypothetical protein